MPSEEPSLTNVQLVRCTGFGWAKAGRYAVKGYAYCEGVLYRGEELGAYFSSADSLEQLTLRLRAANGTFAFIGRWSDGLVAAVDRVRSVPLFYSEAGSWISDDLNYPSTGAHHDLDCMAVDQFLQSGYTIGARTLLSGIRQLQAGQMLLFGPEGPRVHYYFRHFHTDCGRSFDKMPVEELLEISDRVFTRLIDSCSGRQIVVPLSGGYDSRYIAAMLKRLGYDNVFCFSYGRSGSFEAKTSEIVAKRLGFRWAFVEYTHETWRKLLSNREYALYASNGCSLPHIQGIPALVALQESGAFEDDAIFVPGFCGDLLGGSYIPRQIIKRNSEELAAQPIELFLAQRDFSLRGDLYGHENIIAAIREEVPTELPYDERSYISVNEEFFTRHKVARFVVNDVRSFEFIGHEWRLPLWDSELTDFWYSVDANHRLENRLYNDFLMAAVFEPYGVDIRKGGVESVRKRIVRGPLAESLYRVVKPMVKVVGAQLLGRNVTDSNAFGELDGLLRSEIHGQKLASPKNINAHLAIWFIHKMVKTENVVGV